jgi:hypothetical protein
MNGQTQSKTAKGSTVKPVEVPSEVKNNNNSKPLQQMLFYYTEELAHHRSRVVKLQIDSSSIQQLLVSNTSQIIVTETKGQFPIQKVDSISILLTKNNQLSDSLAAKMREIIGLKGNLKESTDNMAQLNQFYNNSLDTLLKYTNEYTVLRDSKILTKNNFFPKRMAGLQIYFEASKRLSERYDVSRIEYAKSNLKKIESCTAVDNLIDNLSYYSVINNSLKKTIEAINEIDKIDKTNGIPVLQDKKQSKILGEIGKFYRDNQFEPGVYIYLEHIIKDLLKDKLANVDADIKSYGSKL